MELHVLILQVTWQRRWAGVAKITLRKKNKRWEHSRRRRTGCVPRGHTRATAVVQSGCDTGRATVRRAEGLRMGVEVVFYISGERHTTCWAVGTRNSKPLAP